MRLIEDYTTLTSVRTEKGIVESGDDALLRRYIRVAGQLVNLWTTRRFVPIIETNSFGWSHRANAYDLKLDDDLLEITTLTDGAGTVITSDLYNLRPDNVYPKRTVELKSAGSYTWQLPYRESRITINGVFGYHSDYTSAWGDSLDTVQNNPLTASGTSLTVNDADGLDDRGMTRFEVGDLLKFGDTNDFAQVTFIGVNTLTILRGVNGSTAAEHAQDTPVYVYRQLDDIRFMANEIVKWLYEHRDSVNVGVQLAQNIGVVIVRELPEIKELADFYVPKAEIRAV